jgi:predicted nucleic acid-binding protein
LADRVILVDSSVWIDHVRGTDPILIAMLEEGGVFCHPFIIGEVMMGTPRNRHQVRKLLARLPQMQVATDAEVLEFIEHNRLYGIGIGYIDAHLLASVRLEPNATIWTRDRRMAKTAETLGIFATDVPKIQ